MPVTPTDNTSLQRSHGCSGDSAPPSTGNTPPAREGSCELGPSAQDPTMDNSAKRKADTAGFDEAGNPERAALSFRSKVADSFEKTHLTGSSDYTANLSSSCQSPVSDQGESGSPQGFRVTFRRILQDRQWVKEWHACHPDEARIMQVECSVWKKDGARFVADKVVFFLPYWALLEKNKGFLLDVKDGEDGMSLLATSLISGEKVYPPEPYVSHDDNAECFKKAFPDLHDPGRTGFFNSLAGSLVAQKSIRDAIGTSSRPVDLEIPDNFLSGPGV